MRHVVIWWRIPADVEAEEECMSLLAAEILDFAGIYYYRLSVLARYYLFHHRLDFVSTTIYPHLSTTSTLANHSHGRSSVRN